MQSPSAVLNIGADVAKDAIVVACSEGSFPVREVANQRTAVLTFLKGLPADSRIGVESTGTYHELFAEAAHQLGFLVFLLNPKDTRHYAKAVGLRGKTDRVDAELIARMIAHEHTKLHAWIPPTPQQREIDRLIKRRATLISLRGAVAMSLHELGGFADELKALRTRFNQLIARIDLRVKALIEASPDRKQNFTRLCTISGVGPVVGTALVNTLERVPVKSADAFVAFTGLDPRPDDSGQHRGKRRLSKRGPAELRRLLYLAAMSAAKTKTWRPLYEHYRAKGLSSTATLVILARRIARTAWSIYTHKTDRSCASHESRFTNALTQTIESLEGEALRPVVAASGLIVDGPRPVPATRLFQNQTFNERGWSALNGGSTSSLARWIQTRRAITESPHPRAAAAPAGS